MLCKVYTNLLRSRINSKNPQTSIFSLKSHHLRCFGSSSKKNKNKAPYDPSKMIIETHQLKQLMNEGHDNLTILHAMVEPPETKVKDPMNNLCKFYNMMNKGHIPTARVFPLIPYSDLQSGFNLMMPKQERFREIARHLDLRINDTFVCYDFDVVHSASRLAWTLKGFGAK